MYMRIMCKKCKLIYSDYLKGGEREEGITRENKEAFKGDEYIHNFCCGVAACVCACVCENLLIIKFKYIICVNYTSIKLYIYKNKF